jgi:predicted nucleotidyltransferase
MGEPQVALPTGKIAVFCRKWRIKEFSIFGSVLREDFGPDSDIDVLVTFDAHARHTLFDLARMEEELRDILGRKVDIISRRGIEGSRNDKRKNAILSSAKAVYVA